MAMIGQKDNGELEKKYSYEKVIEFLKICEKSNESSLLVRNPEDVNKAIEIAKDDFDLEAIARSLAVNGYFDAAQKLIENELSKFDYRIRGVKIVMCIELFRRNELDKAKIILNEVYPYSMLVLSVIVSTISYRHSSKVVTTSDNKSILRWR